MPQSGSRLIQIYAPAAPAAAPSTVSINAPKTPLEQYGGDTGHTDRRSDIYAFGATIYHLLTNQPPAEAKQRFLQADALERPRLINPQISSSEEAAILWAMALHPDDRPPHIDAFRQALFKGAFPATSSPAALAGISLGRADQALAAAGALLLLIALVASVS